MNKDEAMRISGEALNELEELLAEGRPETLKRYLDQMAVFHKYSFLNVMMILAQNPNASQVAGFGTWKKLGRWVKADEQGIGIFAPLIQRKADREEPSRGVADTTAAANQRVLAGFRVVHVFDLSQTEGEAMPELSKPLGEPGEALPHLFRFSEYSGITVVEEEIPWGSTGVSKGGKILLRPGLSDSEKFSVLAHELAHEFLH